MKIKRRTDGRYQAASSGISPFLCTSSNPDFWHRVYTKQLGASKFHSHYFHLLEGEMHPVGAGQKFFDCGDVYMDIDNQPQKYTVKKNGVQRHVVNSHHDLTIADLDLPHGQQSPAIPEFQLSSTPKELPHLLGRKILLAQYLIQDISKSTNASAKKFREGLQLKSSLYDLL